MVLQEGFERLNLATISPIYWVLAKLGIESFGVERLSAIPQGDKRIPRTLLAIGDLALFTPIGSIYGQLRTSETTWRDIHPGYRFLAALDLVAKQDLWISDLSHAEALGTFLSTELGWVPPRRFLELGVCLQHQELVRHRDACRMRLDTFAAPYQFDKPERTSEMAQFLAYHMPLTRSRDPDPEKEGGEIVMCPVPPGDREHRTAIRKLRDCYFTRLFWYGMREGWQGDLQCYLLPDDIDFAKYFDNIQSSADFIALVTEKYPWASPHRLALLPTA